MFLFKCSLALCFGLYSASVAAAQQKVAMMEQRPVAVPDFQGKTLQQVQAAAVVPGSQKPLFSAISSRGPTGGRVASQTPLAHTPVNPGSTPLMVTLDSPAPNPIQPILQQIFAPPKQLVLVPELEGDSGEQATRLLRAARLKPVFVGDADGVAAQEYPPAGKAVEAGSAVTVTLAVPQAIVPSLFGMTEGDAQAKLNQASLQLGSVDGQNSDGSSVTSQSIVAGTHVPRGTAISVTLTTPSLGTSGPPAETQQPPQVVVPNLMKKSDSEAKAALLDVGLQIGKVGGPAQGLVINQTPGAGSMVDAQTAVDFTLQAALVMVPNVLQDSEQVAESRLQTFRLRWRSQQAADWKSNAAHVVVRQTPGAGTNVAVGTVIGMVIGNVVTPPSWWQKVPGSMWLGMGATLCGVIVIALWRKPPPLPSIPASPPAVCSLETSRGVARIRLGDSEGAKVRFTVGLRDVVTEARYRLKNEPGVRRKG